MVYLQPLITLWTKVGGGAQGGLGFYRLGVTLCKEAGGDMVSDECGLFKGPQGWTLSLIPSPLVGLLSALRATG